MGDNQNTGWKEKQAMVFKIIYFLVIIGFVVANLAASSNQRYGAETFVVSLIMAALVFFFIFNIHLFYIICSAPLRKKETIGNFLDLIRAGMKNGKSPDQTIVELSRQGEHELGDKFDRVATCIDAGDGFIGAIRKNSFMPENIIGILEVGVMCGDLDRILPACYESLKQYQSRSRAALNYLLPFLILFISGLLFAFLTTFIFPKWEWIAREIEGRSLNIGFSSNIPIIVYAIILIVVLIQASVAIPGFPEIGKINKNKNNSSTIFNLMIAATATFGLFLIFLILKECFVPYSFNNGAIAFVLLLFAALLAFLSVFYARPANIFIYCINMVIRLMKPKGREGILFFSETFMAHGPWGSVDYISYYLVPWKRNRIRGGFASMLTILLDSGIPEPEALEAAAKSTGNKAVASLARRGVSLLGQGYLLPDVLTGLFDSKGELAWRICNSRHADSSLNAQIRGWCSFLDASAFRSEQAFAHVMSTVIILCLGALVGLVAIAMFGGLISVITNLSLW